MVFFRYDDMLVFNNKFYVVGYYIYDEGEWKYEVLFNEYDLVGNLLNFYFYSVLNWCNGVFIFKYREEDGFLLIGGVIDNKNWIDNNFEKYNKLWVVDILS